MSDDEYLQAMADAIAEGRVKPPRNRGTAEPGPRDPREPPESSLAENRRMWRTCLLVVPVVCLAVFAVMVATGWLAENWNYWLASLGLF